MRGTCGGEEEQGEGREVGEEGGGDIDGGTLSSLLFLGNPLWLSCYINFYIKVTDSTIPQVTEVPPHSVTQHILPSGEVSFVQPFRERPACQINIPL